MAGGEILQKGQRKEKRQQKNTKKLTKRAGKLTVTQGENTEIFARKALKICKMQKSAKCHRLNTAKCYENTNFEYTKEYTKYIKDTYYNKNHQIISSK